jgi:hypothetical protein
MQTDPAFQQPAACHPGLLAHCRRVDAWSSEIGHEMRLPAADLVLLSEASRLHHFPPEMLSQPTVDRILGDLNLRAAGKPPPDDLHTAELRSLLQALRSRGSRARDSRTRTLAQVIEVANFFDEQLELAPFESNRMDQIFDRALDGAGSYLDPVILSVLRNLRKLRKSELFDLIPRLPVYPAAAVKPSATRKSGHQPQSSGNHHRR